MVAVGDVTFQRLICRVLIHNKQIGEDGIQDVEQGGLLLRILFTGRPWSVCASNPSPRQMQRQCTKPIPPQPHAEDAPFFFSRLSGETLAAACFLPHASVR